MLEAARTATVYEIAPETFFYLMSEGKRLAGLVHVYTGKGKGKTSTAFGLCSRMIGQGRRVCVIQFLKGFESGEVKALKRLGARVELFGRPGWKPGMKSPSKAFSLNDEDKKLASKALGCGLEACLSGKYGLVVLDEVNVALGCRLIDLDKVLDLIALKPEGVELVLTGRNAPRELLEKADYVTEMREVRHPMAKGIDARQGIEY